MIEGGEGAPGDRSPLAVRPATPDDVDSIARLHTTSWQSGYSHILDPEYLAGLDWRDRATRWREIIERPQRVLVATRDGEPVGFATGGAGRDDDATEGDHEVYALYVRPDAWRTGAGTVLLRELIDSWSGAPTTLWVLADNERAIAFYARQGFAPDATRKPDVIGGRAVTEIRLRRPAD